VLREAEVAELLRRCWDVESYQMTIDLERKIVADDQGFSATFPIEDFARHCLWEGLDDIGLTLQHESDITAYESHRPAWQNVR